MGLSKKSHNVMKTKHKLVQYSDVDRATGQIGQMNRLQMTKTNFGIQECCVPIVQSLYRGGSGSWNLNAWVYTLI